MKLTHKNYHTKANIFLTTSKVKDYLLDPHYFYKKHVERAIEEDKSDALVVGSMVDLALSEGVDKMNSLFEPVTRRNKNREDSVTEVTQAMYDEAISLVIAVMGTTAWKEIKKYKNQVVLEMPLQDTEHFGDRFVGMLDFLHVDEKNKKAVIVDLKTSRTVDSRKYTWHAIEFGYWLQAAAYSMLVKINYDVDTVDFYHLVVEKDPKGINKVKTFKFEESGIKHCEVFMLETIRQIYARTDWSKADCDFESAEVLKMPSDESVEEITNEEWDKS